MKEKKIGKKVGDTGSEWEEIWRLEKNIYIYLFTERECELLKENGEASKEFENGETGNKNGKRW